VRRRQSAASTERFQPNAVWFWPKIAAALVSKHHWLVIACDSCGTVVDLDLRVKPRDLEEANALYMLGGRRRLERLDGATRLGAG
jgi:hypothetical protein